jgi:hypothetical protein
MAVPSYLSTFLWMQQLRGADVFATRFPGLWAVWEPGPWRPAADVKRTISFGGETGAPTAGGDYLCFHLGAADGRVVSLGRRAATANESSTEWGLDVELAPLTLQFWVQAV